jgi:ASC-1-like (ASCH) protein
MNYNLNLNNRPFQAIKAGTKKIEGRTRTSRDIFSYDDLKPADTITFANATTKEKMIVEVIAVRHYPNTKLMLESEGVKYVLSSGLDIEGGIESYNSFSEYRENIPQYGIYAIEIKVKL